MSKISKMLKNAPALAIRGVDTAENEPSKVSRKWGAQNGNAKGQLRVLQKARASARIVEKRTAQTSISARAFVAFQTRLTPSDIFHHPAEN